MNGLHDLVFIGEIVLQAKIAKRAAERLQATNESLDKLEVWTSIQAILVSAANVSKILWPAKQYRKRGERLRQILQVENNNLLSDRKFRNHFEHYDERIEEWFNKQPNGAYVDLAMNPSFQRNSFTNCHRGYDSFNNTLIFRGEILDLDEILMALEEIYNRCKPHALDYP
ncbi:MAG: hypothetical protein J7621_15685 [Niastella sp.]|nr:hypothetical protein [Niastella sp.]